MRGEKEISVSFYSARFTFVFLILRLKWRDIELWRSTRENVGAKSLWNNKENLISNVVKEFDKWQRFHFKANFSFLQNALMKFEFYCFRIKTQGFEEERKTFVINHVENVCAVVFEFELNWKGSGNLRIDIEK